jgi:hypothetical protein
MLEFDLESWSLFIETRGVGKINDNGQRLLEFCAQLQLCITSTFFTGRSHNKI